MTRATTTSSAEQRAPGLAAQDGTSTLIRNVAVIRTGSGAGHPEHVYGTRKPTLWWIFTSRRWNLTATGRRPSLLEYEIPYRSLLPKKLVNLLLSGDVISADTYIAKMAFAPAMALGEAAGAAAALAVKSGVAPKELRWPGPLQWQETGFSCEE